VNDDTTPRRTTRGQARRDAIADAAATMVLDRGIAAVTHRSAADAASVPLGSTTYYFADRDDLVAAAVALAGERESARARTAATTARRRGTLGLARHLVDVVVGADRLAQPARVAALYGRLVEAAGTPAARAGARAWNDAATAAVADLLARYQVAVPADVVLAVVDGSVVSWLLSGDDTGDDTGDARDGAGADALAHRIATGLRHLQIS
jgi:DNA-binding transcriptional regulator YbjK